MSNAVDIRFSSSLTGGTVDEANGVIRGVSLMTGNLTAEGHNLEVDEVTLRQVLACAKKTGKIPVKLDHGGGITTLCGYIDGANAVIEGNKVRGDWHLLRSHREFATTMEKARTMPECFGLSAAFKGSGEVLKTGDKKGKKAARCERLLAVDLVTQPAANPDGLFQAKRASVDTRLSGMANPNHTQSQITPDDAPAWAKQLIDGFQQLSGTVAQQQQQIESLLSGGEPDLAELANLSDEELAAAGYDVGKVRQAVEDAIASGELTVEGEGPGDGAGQGGDSGAGGGGGTAATAAGAGPGGAGAATAMGAKQVQEMITFEISKVRRQAREAAEAQEAEHAFQVIEAKVTELAAQNAELVELSERQGAEIKALRSTLKTAGVRGVAPGVEAVTLFSAKGAEAGSFEQVVTAEFERLMKQPNMTEVKARSQAIDFGVKRHRGAYLEWRARGGTIQLSAK